MPSKTPRSSGAKIDSHKVSVACLLFVWTALVVVMVVWYQTKAASPSKPLSAAALYPYPLETYPHGG